LRFGLLPSLVVTFVAHLEASKPAYGQMWRLRCTPDMTQRRTIGLHRPELRTAVERITQLEEVTKTAGIKEANKAKITTDVKMAARSGNQFAFELYKQSKKPAENRFFSPASMATSLAMIYAGANGRTKQQMAHVLHFDLPDAQLQAGFGALNDMLNSQNKSYRLNMANRLWLQKGFQFETPFLKSTFEHYKAEPGAVDFANSEQARLTINQWVSEQTNGKISEIIPPGILHDKIRFVLTNAIYFKGTWHYRFPKELTREAPFHAPKNRDVRVPMMNQTGAFQYAENSEAQFLELPYLGGDLSMVILLPKQVDGLPKLEKQLTAQTMQKWYSSLGHADEVEIYLPKFTFSHQISLKDALSSMGMPLAFSDDADFSGISTQHEQKLYEAIHQAFVDVNEEGTEAAAVTGHVGGNAPGPVPQHVLFRADHPFLFLIQDKRTAAILFLGRVLNPKE
jgi:serpin B